MANTSWRRFVTVFAVIVTSVIGHHWWLRNEWFAIQHEQLATIKQLEPYPPPGWERRVWNN
jgi:hypothetical protein